jgi:hypothetical protein
MAQRKETKAKIKVRDLKPKKDAKGGSHPLSGQTRQSGGNQINIVAGGG